MNSVEISEVIDLQKPADLASRLKGEVSASDNTYINNFILKHPKTSLRLPS